MEQIEGTLNFFGHLYLHIFFLISVGVFGLSDHSLLFSIDTENVGAPVTGVAPKSRMPVPVPVAPPRLAPKLEPQQQQLRASLTPSPVVVIEGNLFSV